MTNPTPAVTAEQVDLVRRTIANGATAEELKLYLYDCARHGVHPLDRLLHFTKREGRYVPITSIHLMRIRAAETGEYAGSDDAAFAGDPGHEDFKATVTVWRLVQGQRCAFAASARWSEYCPAPGPSGKGDRMWQKMKHGQLAKCAEALALRKGFPVQLAGLYAKEEMDQAPTDRSDVVYTITPAADAGPAIAPTTPSAPTGTRIVSVRRRQGHGVVAEVVTTESDAVLAVYNRQLADLCEECCQESVDIVPTTKVSAQGRPYLTGLTRRQAPPGEGQTGVIDAKIVAREEGEKDVPF